MFFTVELFIDALILVLHTTDSDARKLVQELLDLYAKEERGSVRDTDFYELYVGLIKEVMSKSITVNDEKEIEAMVLKLKSHPVLVKDPELYTNLKKIFTDKEPLPKDRFQTLLRRMSNTVLWHKDTTVIKKMYGALANNAALSDVNQQETVLTNLSTMCSELIQQNTAAMAALDDKTEETRVTFVDSADKDVLLKALRVYRDTTVAHTFKTGWQGLNRAIGGGFRLGSSIVFNSLSHCGKAVPNETDIKIPGGWKKMGDIRVGDIVTAWDGTPSKVIGVYPQGEIPVYRLTFLDGRQLDASGDHLWTTITYSNAADYKHPGERVRQYIQHLETTKEIFDRFQVSQHARRNTWIPMCKSEQIPDVDLPLDPYLLGVILGDGCSADHTVHKGYSTDYISLTTDRDVVNRILVRNPWISKNDLRIRLNNPESEQKYCVTCDFRGQSRVKITQALKELGLLGKKSWEKFIPDIYKNASHEQRLEMIRGLLDTDGTVLKSAWSSALKEEVFGGAEYATASEQLAKDIVYLLHSFGCLAQYKAKNTIFYYKGQKKSGRTAYRLNIRADNVSDFFTLPRKRDKIVPRKEGNYRSGQKYLRIVSIDPLPMKQECTCIRIDHPDMLFIAGDFVVTHNSLMLMKFARWQVTLNPVGPQFKNPTCLFYSLENETPQNLVQMFTEMYINNERKLPTEQMLADDEFIANYVYDEFGKYGWKLIIDRRLGANFGFPELVADFEEYLSRGFTPLMCVIDYMNMMRKGRMGADTADGNHLLVRDLYTNVCNYLKSHNCTLVTAHQLNRKAAEAARMNPLGAVKRFSIDMLSDSTDPQREVDIAIYQHKEFDAQGNAYLTFKVDKVRYNNDIPDKDKYFAYAFHGPMGILDDIAETDRSIDNIYAYDFAGENAKLYGQENVPAVETSDKPKPEAKKTVNDDGDINLY